MLPHDTNDSHHSYQWQQGPNGACCRKLAASIAAASAEHEQGSSSFEIRFLAQLNPYTWHSPDDPMTLGCTPDWASRGSVLGSGRRPCRAKGDVTQRRCQAQHQLHATRSGDTDTHIHLDESHVVMYVINLTAGPVATPRESW
jgi:hypothetical protein